MLRSQFYWGPRHHACTVELIALLFYATSMLASNITCRHGRLHIQTSTLDASMHDNTHVKRSVLPDDTFSTSRHNPHVICRLSDDLLRKKSEFMD
jgi:hypothetical protein